MPCLDLTDDYSTEARLSFVHLYYTEKCLLYFWAAMRIFRYDRLPHVRSC